MSSVSNGHANGTNGSANGHVNRNQTSDFTLKEESVENLRPLRVIVIGAGWSGIYMGIRIPELLRNVDLTIYEKNEGYGGTWWENRYPGVACDIPAHSYVYTFEPNPNWKNFYASGPEIRDYLTGVARKYSADRFIKCSHKVLECTWHGDRAKWSVTVQNMATGATIHDEADVVVSARGALNDYQWPKIDGLNSFQGKVVHSAAWDPTYDFSNKRIGVIGSGSSAIQIVPQLQRLPGSQLSCFVRGKTWIAQPFGDAAMEKLHLDHTHFTDEDKSQLMSSPERYHAFRKVIESDGNSVHAVSHLGSAFSEGAREGFTQIMRQRLAKKPELAEHLLPSFAVGCRRLTPGPGYLEALTEDNVDFIPTPIARIHPNGVELSDGRIVEIDALVCATGFSAMAAPPFPVKGVDGETLAARFNPYPEAYMSIAVDSFPNFFMMLGPNSGVGSGSLTKVIECIGDYTVKCIRKMQKEDIAVMTVKKDIVADWSELVDHYFQRTVYMDKCRSWYRSDGGDGNRIIGLWPGSTLHAVETLKSPRWEDFDYIYEGELGGGKRVNRMRWLGDGWTVIQKEGGDMSYYIEDEFVDFPSHPLPEDTKKYNVCAYTH